LIIPKLVVLILFAAGGAAAQNYLPEDTGPVSEVYLARADEDGFAGEAVEEFVVTDIPIFCVVRLVSMETTTVKMNLVAVNVPGIKKESHVVSTAYTTKDGENQVDFSGKPRGKWIAGTYRADIFVGDKKAASREFRIRAAAPAAAGSNFAPKPIPNPRKKN
jgi:hypothetical protein